MLSGKRCTIQELLSHRELKEVLSLQMVLKTRTLRLNSHQYFVFMQRSITLTKITLLNHLWKIEFLTNKWKVIILITSTPLILLLITHLVQNWVFLTLLYDLSAKVNLQTRQLSKRLVWKTQSRNPPKSELLKDLHFHLSTKIVSLLANLCS